MNVRFQTSQIHWQTLHASAFYIYFPEGYDSLCARIGLELPASNALVKQRMQATTQAIPNIIIYPSLDRAYQSNIGSFDPADKTFPTIVRKGNRILIAFNGSLVDLKSQLNRAMVRNAWESSLGEGLEEQLQVTKPKLAPYWAKEGMIAWFADGWPVEAEDKLLQTVRGARDWDEVLSSQPVLAGQGLCQFLSSRYYTQAPAQLFQQLRKRKPWERALRLVTKEETPDLYQLCFQYYKNRLPQTAQPDTTGAIMIPLPKGRLLEVIVSEQSGVVAYTLATWHKRTVYLYDPSYRRTTKVSTYALPPWLSDHKDDLYPLLVWNQRGELVAVQPHKGAYRISRYNRSGRQVGSDRMEHLDGLASIAPLSNNGYLCAGWKRGQADILRINPGTEKIQPLTSDRWDDDQPATGSEEQRILFTSIRPLQSEPEEKNNHKADSVLWQGLFQASGAKAVPLAVDTIAINHWSNPMPTSDGKILAIGSHHGRQQFALLPVQGITSMEEVQWGPMVQPYQYNRANNSILTWKYQPGRYDSLVVYATPLSRWMEQVPSPAGTSPWLQDYNAHKAERAKEDSLLKAASAMDSIPSFMDGVFGSKTNQESAKRYKDSVRKSQSYAPEKVSPYVLQLYSAYFTAKVNNDYFINRYQPYQAYQGQFRFPQIGGMAQGGFSDLFEDHHFNIGYRLPAGTEGSDFFVKYRNTKKLVDWGLTYFRKNEQLQPDPKRNWVDENGRPYPNNAKTKTNYYEVNVSYPLTYFSSLSGSVAARQDKTVFLATEKYSLDFPAYKSVFGIVNLAYQVNHLRPTVPLLYRGYFATVAVDAFKGFTQGQEGLAAMSFKAGYQLPLYKYITLNLQLQGGYSSADKILYNLGGLDNALTQRVDSNVHFAQNAPFAFQTLVTPFRGYQQNTTYGSRYGLLNADVYFPLFQTLISLETPLSSINNLQPGFFLDVATVGANKMIATTGDAKASFGFSARTVLAGYSLRFDMGWPGSFNKKPLWYLSLKL